METESHRDLRFKWRIRPDGRVEYYRVLESCANGHVLNADTVVDRSGRLVCRECERTRSREHKRRKHGHKPRVPKEA